MLRTNELKAVDFIPFKLDLPAKWRRFSRALLHKPSGEVWLSSEMIGAPATVIRLALIGGEPMVERGPGLFVRSALVRDSHWREPDLVEGIDLMVAKVLAAAQQSGDA